MAKNGNNTRNPAAPLFKRLTRMLSGPIVNYRTQVARQEKRADLDKYRYRFRSMSGQEFKRHDSNMSRTLTFSHLQPSEIKTEQSATLTLSRWSICQRLLLL